MQTVPGPDDFEPVLAAPEEGQGRPTTADRPKASGRKERQPNQPTVPHPEDLADAAERTKDAIAEGRRAGTAGQAAGRLGGKSGERRGTERARCLAAERCWDQARWAIMAYAWRFDGLGRARRAGGTA